MMNYTAYLTIKQKKIDRLTYATNDIKPTKLGHVFITIKVHFIS
jgi:hypothetical protein